MVCPLSFLPFSFQVMLRCWFDLSYPCIPSMSRSQAHKHKVQSIILSLSRPYILPVTQSINIYSIIKMRTFNVQTQPWWPVQIYRQPHRPFSGAWCTQTIQMFNMRHVKYCSIRIIIRWLPQHYFVQKYRLYTQAKHMSTKNGNAEVLQDKAIKTRWTDSASGSRWIHEWCGIVKVSAYIIGTAGTLRLKITKWIWVMSTLDRTDKFCHLRDL